MSIVDELTRSDGYREKLDAYISDFFKNPNMVTEFIYNSSAIEGSTLTLHETLKLVKGEEITIEGKKASDSLETIGMLEAINTLSKVYKGDITEEYIILLHGSLLGRSNPKQAGVYRDDQVYTYVADKEIPNMTSKHYYPDRDEMMELLDDILERPSKMTLREIAIYKLDFVKSHPFYDGNGRLSRILLNWLLMHNGYPPVNIKVEFRDEYMGAMSDYSKFDNPETFVEMLEKAVISTIESM